MHPSNLFAGVPATLREEFFDEILKTKTFRVERIVSRGHHSPEGSWYDQEQAEWVLLLAGRASLEFETDAAAVTLQPGDYLEIPAHCRHRVVSTDPSEDTVWLAIHY